MERLFSPWRLRYIVSAPRKVRGCIFCRAARSRRDRANLVVARGRRSYVILNKYPYNNGHLMIIPNGHWASLVETPDDALDEMMRLAALCEKALRTAYNPSGINLGMNLGRSAGAGIEGHLHLHLVPRWDGDTNFMTVVHGTRVIPEALGSAYRRLRPLLAGAALVLGSPRARGRQGSGR
jgi:ATP adenylyltransferase